MDIVLKLRELRRLRGLSQKDVAKRCGVGEKTISSFETGERIGSLKLAQLQLLLRVYGVSESEFFSGSIERKIAPWDVPAHSESAGRLLEEISALPEKVQESLLDKFHLMVETAAHVQSVSDRRPYHSEPVSTEWQMLTSRN
jgi:transcriptional regulator with XRE-family HTH domain